MINLAATSAWTLIQCPRRVILRVWLYQSSNIAKVDMEIHYIKEKISGNNCSAKENPNRESGQHMPQRAGVVLPSLKYQGLGSPLINTKTSYRAIYCDCKYSESQLHEISGVGA